MQQRGSLPQNEAQGRGRPARCRQKRLRIGNDAVVQCRHEPDTARSPMDERLIARLTQLRRSPAFEFIADNSIEHGAEISRKINQLKYNQPQQEARQKDQSQYCADHA